jgi:3-deoxy-7-phosphoheptulonate synthase
MSTITTETTADLHVARFTTLPSPGDIAAELPIGDERAALVSRTRDEVRTIMAGEDDRLLVVAGPCSIHDTRAGLEYAGRLVRAAEEHRDDLLIVMRTYFEKPRTTVGWKGLINDPHLDGSHDIATGLRMARGFLRDVTALGMPCATEFLEPISPQYTADLISWGAIGARTTARTAGSRWRWMLRPRHPPRRRSWVSAPTGGRAWCRRRAIPTRRSSCAGERTGRTTAPRTSPRPPHG